MNHQQIKNDRISNEILANEFPWIQQNLDSGNTCHFSLFKLQSSALPPQISSYDI